MLAQIHLVQPAPASPPLEALLAPDGARGAGIRSMCRFLDISHQGQVQRIKRQPELSTALHVVTISTATGPKDALMLEGHVIAIWAAGLQTSRFSPDKQERVMILKRDAYAAIERAFGQQDTATRTQSVVQQPTATPHWTSPFDRIIADMEDMIAGLRELKDTYSALEQRMIILEHANLGRRSTPSASMTPQMIGELVLQLRLLRETIGIPIEEAVKMLAAEFGVAHLSDVDSARWTDIVQKIQQLFQRGNK